MDFLATVSALQGLLGENVIVVVSLREGDGAFPCAIMTGPLFRALEVGIADDSEAVEYEGDLNFDIGQHGEGFARGSFFLRESQFVTAQWAGHALVIQQGIVAVSVMRLDEMQGGEGAQP
jgi:hypothetical protein